MGTAPSCDTAHVCPRSRSELTLRSRPTQAQRLDTDSGRRWMMVMKHVFPFTDGVRENGAGDLLRGMYRHVMSTYMCRPMYAMTGPSHGADNMENAKHNQ